MKKKLKCPRCGSTMLLEGKIIVSCLHCWAKLIKINEGKSVKLVELVLESEV